MGRAPRHTMSGGPILQSVNDRDPRFIHEEYLKNLDAAAELPGRCAGVLVHLGQFLGTCHGVLRSKRENCRASDPGVEEAAGGAVPAAVCDTQGRPHDGVALLAAVWLSLLWHCRGAWYRKILLAAVLCMTTAFLDETIQLFVPGRSGQISDVWVDLLGAAVGIALFSSWSVIWTLRQHRN